MGQSDSSKQEYAVPILECNKEKVVGKPYEGKPHVRFDVAETGDGTKVEILIHSQPKG